MSGSVQDYRGIAYHCFRRTVGAAYTQICEMWLAEDWHQEIALAALAAERDNLRAREALRFCSAAAYAALKSFGFCRPRGSAGFVFRG